MSFKRNSWEDLITGNTLTESMVGIGMLFGGGARNDPNIENTIFSAVYHGIHNQDFRVLSMATLWLEKHTFILNASRLVKLINKHEEQDLFFRYWVAFSQWYNADCRFNSLRKKISEDSKRGISSGAEFLAKRNGIDLRFKNTCLIVPNKMLEKKDWLILSPKKMTEHHSDYRWRLIIGPSYRADMWSLLTQDHSLKPSDLAKKTYGSYATAHRVKKEFEIYSGKELKKA